MAATPNAARGGETARRGTLSRDRILEVALAVADADGVEALTMRRVATRLGVDPMAIYRHVKGKDDLLDGVVERLWHEVPPPPRRPDAWAEPLRDYAHGLRAVVNAHPSAAPLLLTRPVMPRSALEATHTLLSNLQDAGFDELRAARILRSVSSAALGDALAAVTYRTLAQCPAPPESASETDAWIAISQALPADTPTELVRTAYAVCACEPDSDFTFVLDLILQGAQELKRER